MREMSSVFAGVGCMALTGKSFYWITLLANTIFFFAFLAPLTFYRDSEQEKLTKIACDQETQSLT